MHCKSLTVKDCTIQVNVFIAPLAGYTNLPTRLFFRDQGAGIAYTEMVSAMGLHYNPGKTSRILVSSDNDRPLGIQMFGPDPDHIESAFLKIHDQDFDVIDLNCGCPVRKIIKSKGGAWLLQDPDNIHNILKRLTGLTDKPVTVKIRSGFSSDTVNYLEVLDAAVTAGASLITFHPRTRNQFFTGCADWDQIARLKEASPIPVVGNGDIFTGEDAVRMITHTKCDGVMLARGVIENPFLVEEVVAALQREEYTPPGLKRRVACVCNHLNDLVELYGEKRGVLEFRKYFRGYLKGYKNVSSLRSAVNRFETLDETLRVIREWSDSYPPEDFT
jgi:tRNA-dihydrouridine synthase B